MRLLILWIILFCAALLQAEPFVLGADISWIPEREAGNVKYAHNGQVKDIFDILKEHKFNYIRLRLFVDPTAKITGESESPYSAKGYCGTDSTIKMAKRVKAAGMKFLLDFHYSDTWADPAKQYKPVSWSALSFDQLKDKVHSYTKETLEKFKEEGVLPDMVQVGNEIVGGMIWPDGRTIKPDGKTSNMANFAALMNAGIDGVRDVDPNIKIMVHTINERNPNGWLTSLKNAGVTRIDVFGLSYYSEWHGQPDSLQRVVNAVAASNSNNNIRIAVAEYADNHRRVNDIIFGLPENKRFGTFVWEPCDWKEALFDWKNNRRETNSRIALYPVMSKDFGNDDIDTTATDSSTTDSSFVDTTATDSSTSINNNPRQPVADKKLQEGVHINRNGVINYYSDKPGTITIYNVQGRIVGKFNVRSPGVYDPARFLRTPLRSGAYIIAVEPMSGTKKIFNSRIVK